MQIIISIMVVGLLWMIYDVINAPEVDENENNVFTESETDDREAEEVMVKNESQNTKVSEFED